MVAVPLGPAPLDITGVRAGDTNEFTMTIRAGGQPVPLTGATVTAQARVTPTDAVSLDAEVGVVDAANGVITLGWPGEDVRTWLDGESSRSGVWDLQVDDGGDITTIVAGSFTAQMDVTR